MIKNILVSLFIVSLALSSFAQSALVIRGSADISIGSNVNLTVNGNFRIRDIADSVVINNEGIIEVVSGNWNYDNTGKLVNDIGGLVKFSGSGQQRIIGGSDFYDVELDIQSGIRINSGVNRINNSLTLTRGTFRTNDSLVLAATASKTARIAPISTGNITGDVIIECYIQAVDYDYRFLSMPVQNATLNEWYDDFIMTGFIGSQFPFFLFNSIKYYDETKPGVQNARYDSATNITNPIAMGVGVQAYTGGSDFILDVKGEIYQGTLDLPVTFTDDLSQPITQDGWNLVGNPYPSTIDWNSASWTKSSLDDAIYIYDANQGAYQSYVNGAGTNGGSQFIASSQAFFVKANAASPLLRISENVKTAQNISFVDNQSNPDLLSISVSDLSSSDEIVVRFNEEATNDFDPSWDAEKLYSRKQELSLATVYDKTNYSILSLNPDSISKRVLLKIKVPNSGAYHLNFSNLPVEFDCYFLVDLFTGKRIRLNDNDIISYNLSDTTSVAQFELLMSKDINLNACANYTSKNSTIAFGLNAKSLQSIQVYPNPVKDFIYVTGIEQTSNFQLLDALGRVVLERRIQNEKENIDVSRLKSGIYFLRIVGDDLNELVKIKKINE